MPGISLTPTGYAQLALFCALCALSIHISSGLSCMPCYHPTSGKYQGQPCEPLGGCEPAFKPCGCCPECAGDIGVDCHGMAARCRKGLVCVNDQGEAKQEVAWHDHKFRGTCQPPKRRLRYFK